MLENMLDYVRFALYAMLVMLGILLYQAWDKDHPRPDFPAAAQTASMTIPGASVAPAATNAPISVADQTAATGTAPAAPVAQQTGQIVTVTTDLLEVGIDTLGGDIVSMKLLNYPESLGAQAPFVLLNDDAKTRYVAESGLLSNQGPDTSAGQALYTTAQTSYSLTPGQNDLAVTLTWQNKDGLKVAKVYTFSRDSYEVKLRYDVDNQSSQPWQGSIYTQLLRTNTPPAGTGGVINLSTYFGAAISTPQKPFERFHSRKCKRTTSIRFPRTVGQR